MSTNKSNAPNIVYLHSHDTGRFIQPYGAAVPTPHLQQFADESIVFRQAFCANPTCSPSRASLLTGQYPHVCGMFGLAHRGFEMADSSRHLAAFLARHGYRSVLAGHQHEIPHGREGELGYHEALGDAHSGLEEACGFLKRKSLPEPFFLSVGFIETHRPFWTEGPTEPPDRTAPPPGIPDTPDSRKDMARFKASARILDQKIGLVLSELDKRGLTDNTVVLITTDHGIAFPGYKCTLTDGGLGVMLMLRLPGREAAGLTVNSMVSHTDVFPTLCELAGLPVPEYVQGTSMLPLVRGEAEQIHAQIFAEVNFHAAYEPMRCVRTLRHKYIRRYLDRITPVVPNCDQSPSRRLWTEAGWADTPVAREELYDLILDPGEKVNLAGRTSHAATLAEMSGRLDAFMRETNDPLLAGPLAAPPNAIVTAPEL